MTVKSNQNHIISTCAHALKKRTGIFGGSFNPIHNGHIELARQILREAALDEIWFVVTPLNPFKTTADDLLDDDLRLDLTRKALQGETRLVASDYEFHLPKPSYMCNTLKHLATDYPDREFVLIIGADNWLSFDRWAEPDYILAHHEIAVYPRMGFPIDETTMPPNVHLINTRLYPVSSTDIRQRIKNGQPVDDLVPPNVHDTIVKLYR
ncbi:MAG: nicotinate (nicotinamide) nucleotide adenylyltransferase [Prevotella sp.]